MPDAVIQPASLGDESELALFLAQAIADGHAILREDGTVILSAEFVRQIREE
ncbi:hypothetical protein OG562_20245 [Streptomyces sp. NBC_01275]|uniref:hypothetical protein n=1 Tax=Streptomyces sp. NBC_01275 TaxID=2903807 RepID=UPI00225079F9|nr:hypothetical protein [Streptomyces sp. NBC_01275]MCX4763257.1 hypothetical protein [Streptomyces sp. NBC_01275]